MNIAQNLERSARMYPGKPAVLFEDQRISYQDLERGVNQLAGALEARRVVAGDRIALYLPNIPAFGVAYLAAMKTGAVAVSVNSMFKSDELQYILKDSGSKVLFTTAELYPQAAAIAGNCPALQWVVICEGRVPGVPTLEDWQDGQSDQYRVLDRQPDDNAAILYTSGTTGKSKGAILTHGNVVSNMYATMHHAGFRPTDVLQLFLPLFHCFGQNFIFNAAINAGATVMLHRRFDQQECMNAVREHGVTQFFAVPTIYIYLLNSGIKPADLPTVRYYFSAAATMPVEVAKKWWEVMGIPIHEGYGLTETSPFAAYNHDHKYKPGSIGTPIENVEMRVVDENDREVQPGTWGEIIIKGPNVMKGYFGRAEESAEALRGGWFHSGDIGTMDEEGYFYIVDRVKDMINAAGFKVWPREVEEVIYRHPVVKEAVVVGVPDPVKGEAVKAFIITQPDQQATPEQIIGFCREHLATYKVPREVEFVSEIPKSATGKILKRVLRDQERAKQA